MLSWLAFAAQDSPPNLREPARRRLAGSCRSQRKHIEYMRPFVNGAGAPRAPVAVRLAGRVPDAPIGRFVSTDRLESGGGARHPRAPGLPPFSPDQHHTRQALSTARGAGSALHQRPGLLAWRTVPRGSRPAGRLQRAHRCGPPRRPRPRLFEGPAGLLRNPIQRPSQNRRLPHCVGCSGSAPSAPCDDTGQNARLPQAVKPVPRSKNGHKRH